MLHDPTTIGLIGLAVLMVLVFSGVPLAASFTIVGFSGLALLISLDSSLLNMAVVSFNSVYSYTLAVIPLFMLMGAFVAETGVAREAYMTARTWVGQIKGGLAMSTAVACGLFAAVCGSSIATAVTFGKIAYPEMKKLHYDTKLAIGCLAAGGTVGILIPPSTGFILYGILTEVSIGKLFIAGIIPGVLEVVFYVITIYILCRFNPSLGPPAPKTTFRQKVGSLRYTWAIVALFLLVIGGIYGGVFSPTEAGGVGAFGALIIGLAGRRFSRAKIINAFAESARTTSMLILIIIGSWIFTKFLAITNIPMFASEFVGGLPLPRHLVLAIILIAYIFLGCFFDIYAAIILTTPILFPIIVFLGYDPIWYGVIMVRMMEMGMVSPPFGLNLFILSGVTGTDLGTMYRGVIPFLIADIAHVALLVFFPILSTFLLRIM